MNGKGHQAFDRDVAANQGYRYTTNASLSSRTANQRLTDLTRELIDLRGLRVIDVGCGDGTYTHEIFVSTGPASMLGVDAAPTAIALARKRQAAPRPSLRFEMQDVRRLPYGDHEFDAAIVRGLLHHLDDALPALEEISRIARRILLIEPNGYNPVLKVIEQLSSYHREHNEKSYPPSLLRRWIRALGGRVERECYAGLVPFFCPDWTVHVLKRMEPWIEATPVARQLACAVFIVRFEAKHPRGTI